MTSSANDPSSRAASGLVLRPVTPADHDHWMPLWRGYQTFYKVDIPAATSAVTWQRLLDPDEPMHAVIAWQGERAVGMVHWIYHRSCWTVGNFAYLNDVFAEPDVRGTGVGRALINELEKIAVAKGSKRLYWTTAPDNEVARKLYDKVAITDRVQYKIIF
jgi:GNAT superfamily N-acetyltransferase